MTDAESQEEVPCSYEQLSLEQVRALAQEGATKSAELVTKSHLSLTGASGKVGLYYNQLDRQWYLPIGSAPSTHIVKQSHVRLDSIVTNEQLAILTAKKVGMENKKLESQLNVTMKTRVLLDRLYDALGVLRKMPGNGEQLYNLIYATYLDPVQRKHADLIDMLHVSSRTYYRLRTEAISIMSIRLWSAPSGDIDDWLEILTLMENI